MSTAKGERLAHLHKSRELLYTLPCDKLFELPGRPNVVYVIKDYSKDRVKGAVEARGEFGFMFKAFETGQIGPRRLARMLGANAPRNATIHEYLDWTVTGAEAREDSEYDFSGFRMVLLYPRERNVWPAPGASKPEARAHPQLGAPRDPWPALAARGRPLSAATVRSGPGYLEVPFVATHENKRGRGFGRCVLEAIEDIARALSVPRLLLCSTNELHVQATWKHLGFVETTDADLAALDVTDADLIHMTNTVQMQKLVPPPRKWRGVVVKHEAFVARTYAPLDAPPASAAGGADSVVIGMTNSNAGNGAVSGYQTASSLAGSGGGDGGGGADDDDDGGSGGGFALGANGGGAGGGVGKTTGPSGASPQATQQQQQQQQSKQEQIDPGSDMQVEQQQQQQQQQTDRPQQAQPASQQQQQPQRPGADDGKPGQPPPQQQQHHPQQQHHHQHQQPQAGPAGLAPQPSGASSDALVYAPAGGGGAPAAEAMEVG